MSASEAWETALRLLAFRGRSEAELIDRLERRGFAPEEVAEAVARALDYGYLDDARFARERARTLMRQGRGVGSKVLAELTRAGVSREIAREAVAEAEAEFPEDDLLAELAARRFPAFDWHRADDRERQRTLNFFLRRGFALSRVLTFFRDER